MAIIIIQWHYLVGRNEEAIDAVQSQSRQAINATVVSRGKGREIMTNSRTSRPIVSDQSTITAGNEVS